MATKVVIKDVIGSYVYLREARENQNGEKDYSMQIILPKNHPQVEQIKKAITEVAKEHFGEKIKLSMLKIPLRDGDILTRKLKNSPKLLINTMNTQVKKTWMITVTAVLHSAYL